ncbi:MAG: hypothetical protein ACKVOP_07630 [Sphingomonadaceae bacterium]
MTNCESQRRLAVGTFLETVMRAKAKTSPKTAAAKRVRFIKVLTATANVSRAAREAGMGSSTVYRHRAKFETFRAAWDAAIDAALDDLEGALLHRAVNGVEKPIVYGGKTIGTTRTYSDTLGMFLLKMRRPEIYARAMGSNEPLTGESGDDEGEVTRRIERIAARNSAVSDE